MSAPKVVDFREKYEICLQKATDAQGEIGAAEKEFTALNEALLDAPNTEREILIKKRRELAGRLEALKAIFTGLCFRRDSAYLAIFKFNEALEAQETKKAYTKNRELNAQLRQAQVELQRLRNGGSRDMPQEERDEKFIRLQTDVAKLGAEVSISFRDLVLAKAALERAQSETARICRELNIQV